MVQCFGPDFYQLTDQWDTHPMQSAISRSKLIRNINLSENYKLKLKCMRTSTYIFGCLVD